MSAALLTAKPSYHVYFRQRDATTSSSSNDENFSLIVGLSGEKFMSSNKSQQVGCVETHVET